MSANKSHHFVPRCYLKNFSACPSGKTVNLFNIKSRSLIRNAPTKSQCARDFLYGKDELEFHLGDIEGRYAEWITRGVLSPNRHTIPDIALFCRFFTLIRYMRTEAHAARMRAHIALTDALAAIPEDSEFSMRGLDTSDSALARDGIMFALDAQESVSDLKLMFVENRTKRGFVTCDDPVIMTNRFYFQRLGDSNFGFGSAGTIFYMPISPQIAMFLYDADMYSPKKRGRYWIDCFKEHDVLSMNDLVFLKARENIYFRDIEDFSVEAFDRVEASRLVDWQRGKVLVPVSSDGEERIFAEVDDIPETGNYVIWTSQQHPRPDRWPSLLPFRSPAQAYSNGSGMSFARKNTVPPGAPGIHKHRV